MEKDDHLVDFSWLEKSGTSFDQFAVEGIERLCAGAPPSEAVASEGEQLIQQLACRIATRNISLAQVTEELLSKSCGASNSDATTVFNVATHRSLDITRAMIQFAMSRVPTLQDFDWNVKLGVSSSRVSELHEPILSLLLHAATAEQGPDHQRNNSAAKTSSNGTFFTELSLPQLDDLIMKLKNAQDKMLKFR